MKVVALSGSLRAGSSNEALLRAATTVAPPGMEVVIYRGVGGLPPFNPDLDFEGAAPPATVKELRELLASAAGVLISSPEYAHGVPGAFKNALDWLVSSGEFTDRPVVLLNAAPAGGDRAQAALLATITVMGGRVLADASRLAPFVATRLAGEVTDPTVLAALRESLEALARAIRGG